MAEALGPSVLSPKEAEKAFLQGLKDSGGMGMEEAIEYAREMDFWFGPGIDALDVLNKHIDLGLVKVDYEERKFKIPEENISSE